MLVIISHSTDQLHMKARAPRTVRPSGHHSSHSGGRAGRSLFTCRSRRTVLLVDGLAGNHLNGPVDGPWSPL